MKKLKQFSSENRDLTITRCNTPSTHSDSIPPDVFMEIISRLPAKSVTNCRRVSKSWAAILRRPEFDELFLTKSPNQPLILFAFILDGGLPFFTSPQNHQNSSLQATRHGTYLPIDRFSKISPPVRGLVCLEDKRRMLVICNPITSESVTLPQLKSMMMWSKSVLGYDPIEKQFKVFCTKWSPHHKFNTHGEHYVMTLGAGGKMIWRLLQCCKPFRPVFDGGICINGCFYYFGKLNCDREDVVIVCFDVRYEKLSFIDKPKGMIVKYESKLINHKGQLGIFQCSNSGLITRSSTSFDLLILEDVKKNGWTKRSYVLPFMWRNMLENTTKLRIVGMNGTCEIVLSPYGLADPYYLFYYNLEMNSVRKVEIQGLGAFKTSTIAHLFVDYVEDVKFI
ncbi:F-box domain [Arabidopsis thaliana x Arabidopsis arenosa]|uniref:F-box domain n=1 Tax=Arabidopsis thaliana x Arabidopsis arenosa TaxID=1240361 RepID=A0A8T2A2G2_9BRAS|nr:F-box domain [Arabidopsis thaliana x Arabidopsis arenosa]